MSYRALSVLDTAYASKLALKLNAPAARPAAETPTAEMEALRAEGKKYYDAKQYAKARTSYENLLRLAPNDGWALFELGRSMLMIEGSDNVDSMQAVWKRAVALKPTDTELLLQLGDVLYTWDPEASYTALQRVLDLKPDAATQARAHAVMGWSSFFYLDSRTADAEFREALRLDPANDEYLYDIGYNYARAGQRDAAMEVFRQLTTRNQKMAQGLFAEMNKKR